MILEPRQDFFYRPQVMREDPSLLYSYSPPKKDHYIVQAAGNIPKGFTGVLMNRLIFVNGIAYAKRYFDVKIALTRGCKDITPTDTRERLLNRPLKKILVIRNAAFGDCLILTPALKALKKKYPHAQLDVFGRQDSRVVYENLPFIDNILLVRDTELAVVLDEYDEVYDLVHTIECCPEADYRNALDVVSDLLGVEPEDPKPVYNSTQQEIQNAQKLLMEMGIVPRKDSLIIFQAEATAKVRSLPMLTYLTVANYLAKMGHKVLFVGHNLNTPLSRFLVHKPETGDVVQSADYVPLNVNTLMRPHPTTQEPIPFQVMPNHHNVFFAQGLNAKYSARSHFAMAHFASLIISVDSFWSHLAPALNKPCVTIYSNYHPYTRTKYYSTTSIVTADYKKVSCGPCNSLFNTCPLFSTGKAPCIAEVKDSDIIKAALDRLKKKNPLFQEMRDNPPAEWKESRPCPLCKSEDKEPVTCKGSYIYAQCTFCSSIYTIKEPKFPMNEIKSLIKKKSSYRARRNQSPLMYIEAIKQGMQTCGLPLPKVPVADLISVNDKFLGRESWKDICGDKLVQYKEDSLESLDNELVLWVDGLMEKANPTEAILGILNKMKPESFLALILPLADKYDKMNTWTPLNSAVAGLQSVIPSQKGFRALFDKDNGVYKDQGKLLFANMSNEATVVLIQKPKESTDSEVQRKSIINNEDRSEKATSSSKHI